MKLWQIVAVTALSACSIPAQSLRELTLPSAANVAQSTDKSFLVYPFEDERGGEFTYLHGISFVPLVDLFVSAMTQHYPEHGGLLRGERDGHTVFATGGLDSAIPYLLGGLMRRMAFAENWSTVEAVDSQRDLSKFDYVIKGKIKRTEMTTHASVLPCGVLAILGVPFFFVEYHFQFEVVLLKNAQSGETLMRKTYDYEGKKVIGLYYHHTAMYDLFTAGLEQTLPQVVQDLAAALPH